MGTEHFSLLKIKAMADLRRPGPTIGAYRHLGGGQSRAGDAQTD